MGSVNVNKVFLFYWIVNNDIIYNNVGHIYIEKEHSFAGDNRYIPFFHFIASFRFFLGK